VTDPIYCRIGSDPILGKVIPSNSEFNILCDTLPSPPLTVDIEVSNNNIDFAKTGFQFTFIAPESVLDPAHVEVDDQPTIYTAKPPQFNAGREQEVTVTGRGFKLGASCVLGNGQVIAAEVYSSEELKCLLPAHILGNETLAVKNLFSDPSGTVDITFLPTSSLLPTTSSDGSQVSTADDSEYFVSPPFGPVNYETLITISGSNLNSLQVNCVFCQIGDDWVPALDQTDGSVSCVAPASSIPGTVEVRLANDNKEVISGVQYFTYVEDPLVYSAYPSIGTEKTLVTVTGEGFDRIPSLQCKFDDVVAETVVVSDVEVICTVPKLHPGFFIISLETNGQHVLVSGIVFEYYDQIFLTSIVPAIGYGYRGNTVVAITGTNFASKNFTSTVDMVCEFDGIPVIAVVLSHDTIRCVTPPHEPGRVNVTVFLDGVRIQAENNQLEFLYVSDTSVDRINPTYGFWAGGYPVYVFGSNFLNVTSLGCLFGSMPSRGIFISNTSIICLAPSPIGKLHLKRPDIVPVEVTVNGLDYSRSNVTFSYKDPCPAGYFCSSTTQFLSPNGTFCQENSRNFTLCPQGFFQPKEGQKDCVICPVGYICPDLGMSRPVICPAGRICDTTGLRTPEKICPMGHFCLNGTKASSASEFMNDTSGINNSPVWIMDEVTGVVTFNESAVDWSYRKWPAPAVGQSRPQHPPQAQCDGYDCFPGSTEVLAEAPYPCPLGHYCRTGVTTLTPIPKNFSTPQRCFDGFFCPRGSVSPEGQGPCPNGYFCPTPLEALVCPRGHYCPGVGNRAPIECYPGTYNPFEGQANCTVCPTGHICPGWGGLLPEICPRGFVCMALGLSYPVVICPSGYYCGEGTLTIDPTSSIKSRPEPCPAGFFCLGGVASTIAVDWIPSQPWGRINAQKCIEGTYCESGAFESLGSGLCFPGHYCPPQSDYPTSVPLGNFASGSGSVAPTLCFPGTYAPLISQVDCLPCPAGHYCLGYGNYIPAICSAGQYRSQVDSVTCRNCPIGTYSNEIGATDLSLCLACPKGRVCGDQSMTSLSSSASCPAGYLCGYGTDRSRQFLHKVPAGFHGSAETVPDDQYNNICAAGFYCERGTPTSLQYRSKCTLDYYCPESTPVGSAVGVKCPIYTSSLSGTEMLHSCRIFATDVCDKIQIEPNMPMQDVTYIESMTYITLDSSATQITFESSLSSADPTG
jgi:hypothetical protein